MTQLAHLFRDAVARLAQAGITEARQEALQLLEFSLGVTPTEVHTHPEQEIDGERAGLFAALLGRRLAREPLQYITGRREFWSLEFEVSPAVLIPRPETEFLLDRVLTVLKAKGWPAGPVLDMCTGSGVIAAVLALELRAAQVIAVDHSRAALQVAVRNWQRHGLAARVHPVGADLFSALAPGARFALIVANPPYIADGESAALQPEVRDWEPQTALFAGPRGLDVIQQLARQAYAFLLPGGWLFVEIGADQETEVLGLFTGEAARSYEQVAVLRDWSGRPRVLQARKPDGA